MSLEQQVIDLTQVTEQLLQAVNTRKVDLDTAETNASLSAQEAQFAANQAADLLEESYEPLTMAQNIAGEAAISAGEAAASASQALAVYGSTEALQTALQSAQNSARLAEDYAEAASSVVQQDLTGVTAAALHRSPNAITAMFVYDTSKDSDGGAWTEKCQHTSWYNEDINGKWLGAQESEAAARYQGAALGPEQTVNGGFDTDTTWTKGTGWNIASGVATKAAGASAYLSQPTNFVSGKTYRFEFTVSGRTAGNVGARLENAAALIRSANGTFAEYITTNSANPRIILSADASFNGSVDNISVREVTTQTTQTGDYFQLTTDGKFYKLWKNLIADSERLTTSWAALDSTLDLDVSSTVYQGRTIPLHRLREGSANQQHFRFVSFPIVSGQTYRASFFAKADTRTIINSFGSGNLGGTSARVNLADGAVQNGAAQVEAVGNGVYRISYSLTATASGSASFYLSLFTTSGIYQGDGVSGLLVGGVQIENGSVTTSYEFKNEPVAGITEVFRGNKRDFPRLAAIVAEAGNVNIYDLTEKGANGSCPMWMRFLNTAGNANLLSVLSGGGGPNPSTVFAANAILSVGSNGGLALFDFAKDTSVGGRNALATLFLPRDQRISARNLQTGAGIVGGGGYIIANNTVNAVAMTVLPDAPVDPVTGLKVPTIAVATGNGVSVIRHNGTVASAASAGGTQGDLGFMADGRLFVSPVNGTTAWYAYLSSKDLSTSSRYSYYGSDGATEPVLTNIYGAEGGTSAATAKNMFATGTDSGTLAFSAPHNTRARGLVSRIKSAYNTGWLVGNNVRTYLSDIAAGSVTGPELVTNGTFDTDSGWTKTGSATISSGACQLGNGSAGTVYQDITFVPGKSYRVTITVAYTTGRCEIDTTTSGGTRVDYLSLPPTTGTTTFLFTAQGSAARLRISTRDSSVPVVSIDNISVTEVVPDRSYKAKGASITGTLTKSLVASAAQLVAYSGFSNSNYLREPYSADLDFGTGEWSVGAWVNVPVSLNYAALPLGPELVTNGDFSNGTTGWAFNNFSGAPNESYEVVSGRLRVYSTNGTGNTVAIANLHTVGRTYFVTADIEVVSGSVQFAIGGSDPSILTVSNIGSQTVSFYGVNNTGGSFRINMAGNGEYFVDNVSVKEVFPAVIAERGHSSGARISLGVNAAGRLQATAFDGTTTRTVTTTAAYNTGTWLKAEADYTTDGTLSISVNGVEVAATRGNPLLSLNNSNAVLTIGNSFNLDAPFPGSIALLKLSATVPTAEQSVWMYEQEKQMFREGAQCCLPDSGSIVDLSYDDATDTWVAASATNISEWSGLVRTKVTPVPAGSYSKLAASSGVKLAARTTTSPGVDITIPSYLLREELIKKSESAAKLESQIVTFDYVGGFTASTTNGNTAITSVANLTYPTSYIGARVTGSGIPSDTFIGAVSGTTIYLTKAATATATNVQISFSDFILPIGYEAKIVMNNGAIQREGTTQSYTRLFDGFKETIRFAVVPGYQAWIQIQATRSAV